MGYRIAGSLRRTSIAKRPVIRANGAAPVIKGTYRVEAYRRADILNDGRYRSQVCVRAAGHVVWQIA